MNISGSDITAGLAPRVATTQQGQTAPPIVSKNCQAALAPAAAHHRSASQPIIDAEYVDLYSPVRRPPEQQNQWRSLILENDPPIKSYTEKNGTSQRHQQLIARYEQNASDPLSPGSFINLIA